MAEEVEKALEEYTSFELRETAKTLTADWEPCATKNKTHTSEGCEEPLCGHCRCAADMLRKAADMMDRDAIVVELMKKLTEYIEQSCDEWYADYPNSGDSDMAFQRMMNFRMDAHEILKKLEIYDEIADNNRSIKRFQDYWWKHENNKMKQSMLMKQIEFLKDRNKKVAEERSEQK